MTLAAIVLAAGRGTRFGVAPKLLAPFRGKPLVRHAVETARAAGLSPVILVVGHAAEDVTRAAGPEITPVHNPDHAAGQSVSLRAGFAALPTDAEGAFVLLGDMPLVSPAILRAVAAAWREAGQPAAAIPTFGGGRRGNPVLLSVKLAPDIAALAGDTGAGPILRLRPDVIEVPILDIDAGEDVDTPDALRRLQASTDR